MSLTCTTRHREDDGLLSAIVSKAFLLADDATITDPSITRQLSVKRRNPPLGTTCPRDARSATYDEIAYLGSLFASTSPQK